MARRELLRAGLSTLVGYSFPLPAFAGTKAFERREISDLSTSTRTLDSFRAGVRAMLRLPPTDPRNWYRHALIHFMDCAHGNWWFLPWHRGYLLGFEAIIRELSGDEEFALPYWDWTRSSPVPAAMFGDVLDPRSAEYIESFAAFKKAFAAPLESVFARLATAQTSALVAHGLASPNDFWRQIEDAFCDRTHARGLSAQAPDLDASTKITVSASTIRTALRSTIFAGAGEAGAGFASEITARHTDGAGKGVLECQCHDNIHVAMGGPSKSAFMLSLLSPIDPIFFVHHGNIDRLWDVWSRRQAALGRSSLPQGASWSAWAAEEFPFFDDGADGSKRPARAGDFADVNALGYRYSPGFGEDEVPAGTLALALTPVAHLADVELQATAVTRTATAGGRAKIPADAARSSSGALVAEVSLDLGPAHQSRRFAVLVSVSDDRAVETGAITVFKHHDHGRRTYSVPLPEGVAAARSRASVPVDIRLVALDVSPTDRPIEGIGAFALCSQQKPGYARISAIRILST